MIFRSFLIIIIIIIFKTTQFLGIVNHIVHEMCYINKADMFSILHDRHKVMQRSMCIDLIHERREVMKKLLILLLVPVIAFSMVSCEGDILASISEYMGMVGGNVLIEQGIITVDTTQVNEVTTQVQTIVAVAPEDKETPPAPEVIEEIQNALTVILESPVKTEELVQQMEEPAGFTADNPPPLRLGEYLPAVPPEDVTQGDLLVAELVADLVTSAPDPLTATPEEIDQFVSDAQQVLAVIKAVSGAGDIVLDTIITDLLATFGRGMRALISREGEPGEAEFLAYVLPVANSVINAIGYTDETKTAVDPVGLARLLTSYHTMRTTYEQLAAAMGEGRETQSMQMGDLIDYTLSVGFTEAEDFLALDDDGMVGTALDLETILNQMIPYLAMTSFDSVEPPAFLSYKTGDQWEMMVGMYNGGAYPAFALILDLYDEVTDTLVLFSQQVPDNQATTDLLLEYIPQGRTGIVDMLTPDVV